LFFVHCQSIKTSLIEIGKSNQSPLTFNYFYILQLHYKFGPQGGTVPLQFLTQTSSLTNTKFRNDTIMLHFTTKF